MSRSKVNLNPLRKVKPPGPKAGKNRRRQSGGAIFGEKAGRRRSLRRCRGGRLGVDAVGAYTTVTEDANGAAGDDVAVVDATAKAVGSAISLESESNNAATAVGLNVAEVENRASVEFGPTVQGAGITI